MESDVFVPLSQSFATGVALLIPGIGITIWQGWPWWSPLVISGGGVTVTWLYLLNAHRKLLWLVETISHIDLNRDGDTGQPKPEPVTVEVKHTDNGRLSSMQYIDLPDGTTHQQFTDWARGVSSGVKTPARKYWAGTGKPFSRDGYDSFLDAMERAGIVTRSGNNARILTNGGKRAMARVAKTA
ncbi:MAG: hypothetical protein DRI81_20215 [Chloroflexi bacterium]|nr:MAG: hypothetical protein DRI81_20215 [Chloroflexota bacterium]